MKRHDPQTYLCAVEEFHRAFQYRQPTPSVPMFDKETVELRIKTLREEDSELQFASSKVEELDAFCDLQYFLSGSVLALGLRAGFEKEWQRVEHAHGWISMATYINWFEVNLLSGGCVTTPAVDCVIMQNALLDKMIRAGFRDVFDDAFQAVHENNMEKLWDESDLSGAQGEFRVTPSSPGKFVVTRADGKILKPARHKKVELGKFCKVI